MTAIDWQFVTLTHSADLSIVAYAKIHVQFDQMSCINWLNEWTSLLLAATMAIVCRLSLLSRRLYCQFLLPHTFRIDCDDSSDAKQTQCKRSDGKFLWCIPFLDFSVCLWTFFVCRVGTESYTDVYENALSMYWNMFFVSSSTCSCRRHLESMFFFHFLPRPLSNEKSKPIED